MLSEHSDGAEVFQPADLVHRIDDLCRLADTLPTAAVLTGVDGAGGLSVVHANAEMARLVDLPPCELVGRSFGPLFGETPGMWSQSRIVETIARKDSATLPLSVMPVRGIPIPVMATYVSLYSDAGSATRYHFWHIRLDDSRQAIQCESKGTSSGFGVEALSRVLPGFLLQRRTQGDRISSMRDRLVQEIGLDGTVVKPKADAILPYVHPEDRTRVASLLNDATTLRTACRVTFRTVPSGLGTRWITTVVNPIVDSDRIAWEISSRDVTDTKDADRPADSALCRDPLTGLVNRQVFIEVLADVIRGRGEGNGPWAPFAGREDFVSLHLIDLDDFSDINQVLGHEAGDELIRIFGARLAECVASKGVVARLGDDEYAVVLRHFLAEDGDQQSRDSQVRGWAERLAATISRPIQHAVGNWVVWGTQGIAVLEHGGRPRPRARDDGTAMEKARRLVKSAQAALHYAKREQRRGYAVYSDEVMAFPKQPLVVRQAMESALENSEFELYFQPKVDLIDGSVIGAEALLRWFSPDVGRQAPAFFIPIAETTGMIIPIGRWILHDACRFRTSWGDRVPADAPVAVNVSSIQLRDPQFVDMVEETLQATGLEPRQLEIELTEGLLILASDAARQALGRLRSLGVRIVIDDFGSGYASFGYLRDFEVDGVKIDRQFVQSIRCDRVSAAITRSILSIGRTLDLDVVAEGVETPEERQILVEEGCPQAQGFLFSPPVPKDSFMKLLSAAQPHGLPRRSVGR